MPLSEDIVTRVVGIHWASGGVVLGINQTDGYTEVSDDGVKWEVGFGEGTSTAATGLGFTVAGDNKFVVFGEPRDGDPCFIAVAVGGSSIERGVLKEDGTLTWSTVVSLPDTDASSGAQGLSFAGDGFFVSYLKQHDDDATYLASSFNGNDWTTSINAFTSIPSAGDPTDLDVNSGSPVTGTVAFDPVRNRYCVTGYYFRNYYYLTDTDPDLKAHTFSVNFMWSTSSDGVTWTPGYDTTQCNGSEIDPPKNSSGIGGGRQSYMSTAWGKGVFVASTSDKANDIDGSVSPGVYHEITACAVATSSDGLSWNNQKLPGATREPANPGVSSSFEGVSAGVAFIETGGDDVNGNPEGFFIAIGNEFQSFPTIKGDSKLWISDDGLAWRLVRTSGIGKGFVYLSAADKDADAIVI